MKSNLTLLEKVKSLAEMRSGWETRGFQGMRDKKEGVSTLEREILDLLLKEKVDLEKAYNFQQLMINCLSPWGTVVFDYDTFSLNQEKVKKIQKQLEDIGLASIGIDMLCEADLRQEASYDIKVLRSDKIMYLIALN